jgi:HJR/Mrr/RecB family endonuclease
MRFEIDNPDDDLLPDIEDIDDLCPWERSAQSKIQNIIDSIEFNEGEGTITARSDEWDPRGKGDVVRRTFAGLDEFRQELIALGDSEISSHVPWENGPVYSTDSDDIVDNALDNAGISRFFESADIPEESELLLDADDISEPEHDRQIIITLEEVNAELIRYLAVHPEKMREMNPRKFEELVAELFRSMGYDVELTPYSKDGGLDIMAVQRTGVGRLLTLIECKRYGPQNKVDVGRVRALYGVVEQKKASYGVIATTSFFTHSAQQFQQNLQYRLSLNDFNDLTAWCRQYKR